MHNPTVDVLLDRRSIRAFQQEPIDPQILTTIEAAAQHAASSQYLNDWSAIRILDHTLKQQIAEVGHQPYIADAAALYVFVLDEYRNAVIARNSGVAVDSDEFTLNNSYRFSQAQNDAVLALHAMETAAESLGLGCVILGSILNDVPRLIELMKLPEYTYPVLGLAIGKPAQQPNLKPRLPRSVQFFDNAYNSDPELMLQRMSEFNEEVPNTTTCVMPRTRCRRMMRRSRRKPSIKVCWSVDSVMRAHRGSTSNASRASAVPWFESVFA